jgi:hypothetical protein
MIAGVDPSSRKTMRSGKLNVFLCSLTWADCTNYRGREDLGAESIVAWVES